MDGKKLASKAGIEYTDVVVIGNGPSGISLSFMLAGNWPYYEGASHPIEYLHARLQDDSGKSLIQQDLAYLSDGLEGRSSNQVGLLFDALVHPNADLGLETESTLRWQHHPEQAVPHVVLGRTKQGGAWQMIEGNMQTLSLGTWMELPDLPFKPWVAGHRLHPWTFLCKHYMGVMAFCRCKAAFRREAERGEDTNRLRPDRASVQEVRTYYEEYVKEKKLGKYFRPYTVVTSVQKVLDISHSVDSESGEQNPCSLDHCGCQKWEVRGYEILNQGHDEMCQEFCFRAPHVVMATGTYDISNRLGVPGENLPFVVQSLSDLETMIKTGEVSQDSDPIVVVGAGLSAADVVLTARSHNIPVVHVFRKEAEDPSIIFRKLPKVLYPEYHKVHQMMLGCCECFEGYEAYPSHRVVEFRDNKVIVRSPGSCESIITASVAVVQIGVRPDLSFLPQHGRHLGVVPDIAVDSKHNPVDVDPISYQSRHECGLYAMGPLVGDNFVRFIQGGALAITSHLWHKRNHLL